MSEPNTKLYTLRWHDGAPYARPGDDRTLFTLAEAMQIAGRENVNVIDPNTGKTIWRSPEATR